MFTKGNKVFADAYKYLKYKNANVIGLVFEGTEDEFKELDMTLDIDIIGNMVFWSNRKFANKPKTMHYEDIKESLIKARYSADDQMAIMLNKDIKDDGEIYYIKMQEYRSFAADLAKRIVNHIQSVKDS